MTPSMREALEWADSYYKEHPPAPLTPSQERALALFGKVTPRQSADETSLLVA